MHHPVSGINSLIHSVSLASHVSTHLLIHLSTHLYYHPHSRHPSLLHSFTPDLKPTFSTNLSHFSRPWTVFTITGPDRTYHASRFIISPYSVAFGVILILLFVFLFCLYGWGYLNAGWCDRREILAQGRANTRDGNEVARGWSANGGPWGGGLNIFWGEGTHFRE